MIDFTSSTLLFLLSLVGNTDPDIRIISEKIGPVTYQFDDDRELGEYNFGAGEFLSRDGIIIAMFIYDPDLVNFSRSFGFAELDFSKMRKRTISEENEVQYFPDDFEMKHKFFAIGGGENVFFLYQYNDQHIPKFD